MALNSPARRQFIFFLLSDFPQQFPWMLNIMFKPPLNSNVQNSCVQLGAKLCRGAELAVTGRQRDTGRRDGDNGTLPFLGALFRGLFNNVRSAP